jgi:ectoine hydroxylase-related dioxygenase (phytanoyl-CoA dioxygenase family)
MQMHPTGRDGDIRESFRRNGYVRLSGIFTGEQIGELRRSIDQVVAHRRATGAVRARSGGKSFLQTFNVWIDSYTVRTIALGPRIGKIAADLMGCTAVRLIHDQSLFKEPGDARSRWHTDARYWPIEGGGSCSVWVPLQDTDLLMGPICHARGSHTVSIRREPAAEPWPEEEADTEYARILADHRLPICADEYAVGDLSVHDGWTVHEAGPNNSKACRRALVLHLMDAECTLAAPINPEQEGHIELFGWTRAKVGAPLTIPACPQLFGSC